MAFIVIFAEITIKQLQSSKQWLFRDQYLCTINVLPNKQAVFIDTFAEILIK